ncbi:S8 family serine peptidase [Desulfococcus sp.]|uniref:S8 family serine peptidase n=1 Tax=Desulfococcus sp. TaxID=2025834 RepID=UPI0035947FEC
MKRQLFAVMLFLILCAAAGPATHAGEIDPLLISKLNALGPDEEVPVIIYLYGTVDLTAFTDKDKAVRSSKIIKSLIDKKDATQKELLQILKKNKIKNPVSLWIVNGIAARVPASLVDDLAGLQSVEKVVFDATITLPPEPAPAGETGGSATPQWNIDAVRAPDLWAQGFDGTGVVVAVMDSGADLNHPDIGPRYRGGTNSWYDPNGQHAAPYDASGHGTQALGLIVGGDAGGSAIGMAPGARWIAVKIFDDSGQASLSDIHLGFQWVLDPDGNPNTGDGPDIVNNSWYLDGTYNQCNAEFADDIAVLKAAEIAVTFAAGNSGPSAPSSVSPANNPGSFAVGAVDGNGNIAYFSSRGPSACAGDVFPEITAPGQLVRASDLTFGGIFPNSYVSVTGTSFSTPHVSGAMALLLNAMAGQGITPTVSQMESAIGESAADLGAAGPDNLYGAGLLDAAAAYDWLLANSGSPQPGQLQFSTSDYSVDEAGGSVTVTVTRTSGSAGAVAVDYATSNGTAAPGADYVAASGTLSFADGQTSRMFTITILNDTVHEGDEDLTVTLSNATGGAVPGYPDSALVTIIDDDPPLNPDSDGDGYAADVDCNDNDAAAYPGAPEVKHDGIDQDCNGYDLTIDITHAVYQVSTDKLTVYAESGLGAQAGLKVTMYLANGGSITRNMTWNATKSRWQRAINSFAGSFGSRPVSVTVFGPEGSESASIVLK